MLYQQKLKKGSGIGKVTVEVDSKWAKIARSPLYWIVSSLQGVTVGFTPFFFYFGGKGSFRQSSWFVLPLWYLLFMTVFLFYLRLGNGVVKDLRKLPKAGE
jgi:succinate dehydrogenase/fumarate reductase cytochrome b subunit